MKMYRTSKYGDLIKEVEIIRETPKQVVLKNSCGREQREAKKSSYYNYFKTFQEAKDYLIQKEESEIANLKNRLKESEDKLKLINDLN